MTDTDKTEELQDIFRDAGDGQTTFTDEQDEQAQEGVIESTGDEPSALPTTDSVTCSECGNGTARWYLQQTRAADESETRFFTCTECGYRWREDDN